MSTTGSKNKDRDLKKQRDFLESIFKTSEDGVVITAEKGFITMVNQAMAKMLGYSKNEMIGKLLREFQPTEPEDLEKGMVMITKLREEGFVNYFEIPFLKNDGSRINVEVSAIYLRDENGVITGSVGVFRDITERKPSGLTLTDPEAFRGMIAADITMAQIFRQAEVVAATDYNLIISGETGTGKELLAKIIHNLSTRSKDPFIAVNVAAFSQTLFESSFFGHEKGSFTGADVEKEGLFEAAQGGTLYLDEITELQISLQAKLLRAIQEREFFRVGGTKGKKFDVRFIASTNRDIEEAIRDKSFREDLFYRLNMFHIHIPPLRKRKKDIIPLAEHFLKIHTEKNNKSIDTISPDLIAELTLYSFPGNVRELESIIAKAVIAERTETLNLSSAHNLLESIELDKQNTQAGKFLTLGELEKNHINSVLRSTQGNRTRAAKILGISVRTLQRKIIAYNIK